MRQRDPYRCAIGRRSRGATNALFALLVTAVACDSAAQARSCPAGVAPLVEAARSVHEKQQNVGMSFALMLDGELVVNDALGMAEAEHAVAAQSGTIYSVASVTKAVTAAAVLKLWAAGRLDLDAPVQRYVPSFPRRDEGVITARLLATHRSGLPHPSQRTPELLATHYETATEALAVFRDVALVSPPGERRVYSSSNYNLLAAIVESITGRNFKDFVREEILDPVGMASTRFDDVLAVIPLRAHRYTFYHPWTYAESPTLLRVPTWDYSFNLGGGGLLSTAGDLVRFGNALLDTNLLTPPAHRLFFSDGWFGRTSPAGERLALMTGSNPGVQAALAIAPSRKAAAAVLANAWGRGSRSAEMVSLASVLIDRCFAR